MSLNSNLQSVLGRIATEFKAIRTLIGGSGVATISGLSTTNKTSLVAAINEVNSKPTVVSLDGLSDVVITTPAAGHILRFDGTDWDNVVPTVYFEAAGAAASAQSYSIQRANHTGTQSADTVVDGTSNKVFTAAEKTKLGGVATGATANATDAALRARASHTGTQAASTITGLSTVAISGSAADLTGVLNTAQLPALAINETFTVASQAAMLALTAQRGDMAIRTDLGKMFVLTTDAPGTLANWTQLSATGDVISVAGRTGTVVLTKSDVGLGNVDNTSDASKPVSTAQQTAINGRQPLDGTLTALAGVTVGANQLILATGADAFTTLTTGAVGRAIMADATAAEVRTEIQVYSTSDIGNPEQDLVAVFEAALV